MKSAWFTSWAAYGSPVTGFTGWPFPSLVPRPFAAERAGRDVDHRAPRRVEQRAVPDELDELVLEDRVRGRVAEARLRAGIDRHAVTVGIEHAEPVDQAPLRADGGLQVGRADAVLRDGDLHLERLPAVRVRHLGAAVGDHERRVDRGVGGIAVPAGFVGAVAQPALQDPGGDPVADGRWRVALQAGLAHRVAQRPHEILEVVQRVLAPDGGRESGAQDAIGRVADRLRASGMTSVAVSFSRKRYPDATGSYAAHASHMATERWNRFRAWTGGFGSDSPDGGEQLLVPAARDRPLRVRPISRTSGRAAPTTATATAMRRRPSLGSARPRRSQSRPLRTAMPTRRRRSAPARSAPARARRRAGRPPGRERPGGSGSAPSSRCASSSAMGRAAATPVTERGKMEATTGFEPVNRGFADLRVEPLHHVAPRVRGFCHSRLWDRRSGCPSRIRTSPNGSKVRCPTTRPRGNERRR